MLRKCLYRTEPLWTRALLSIKIAKLVSYRKKNQTKRKQKPSSYTISPVSIQINSSSPTVKVTWFWPLVKDFVIFYRYCGCKDKKCRFFLVTWNLTLDEIKHTPIFNWESNGEMDEIRKFIFGLMWFSSSPQTLFYYYIRTVINSSTNTKIKVVCYKWNSILIGRTIPPPPSVCNRLTNQKPHKIFRHSWEKRIDFSQHSSCEPFQFELFVCSQISSLLGCVHTDLVVKHASF